MKIYFPFIECFIYENERSKSSFALIWKTWEKLTVRIWSHLDILGVLLLMLRDCSWTFCRRSSDSSSYSLLTSPCHHRTNTCNSGYFYQTGNKTKIPCCIVTLQFNYWKDVSYISNLSCLRYYPDKYQFIRQLKISPLLAKIYSFELFKTCTPSCDTVVETAVIFSLMSWSPVAVTTKFITPTKQNKSNHQ